MMELNLAAQILAELQALHLVDLLTIGTLAILEGILSVDNALVLAILVRTLPPEQRKKALTYGIIGAFVFRFIALIFAAHLMQLMVFKLIGGGYLVYLAMKHMFFFYKEDAHQSRPKTAASFWKTVLLVELTDIAFSIDSITTAVAMSDKLIIVWTGGILGIIFLRFAAGYFVKLLEKLPRLEDLAYQLIFFIGTKLTLEAFHVEIAHGIFWLMMGIIAVLGASLVYRDYHQRTTRSRHQERLLDQLDKGEISAAQVLQLEYVPRDVIDYLQNRGHLTLNDPAPGDSPPTQTRS
jgi:YkoY family integral membrane protein